MSLGDTISITYNAVSKTLARINQDNFGANYYLEDGLVRYNLSIKHTIPARGKFGESHLARLDVEHYDAEGVLTRTASSWSVIRTDGGIQDSTSSTRAVTALQSFLTAPNIAKIVGRES
jgi:hypothetical protein